MSIINSFNSFCEELDKNMKERSLERNKLLSRKKEIEDAISEYNRDCIKKGFCSLQYTTENEPETKNTISFKTRREAETLLECSGFEDKTRDIWTRGSEMAKIQICSDGYRVEVSSL